MANQIQELRGKLWDISESMGIDAKVFSGGFSILWDPSRVTLTGFQGTRNVITTNFKVVGFPISGIIMNVYGPQKSVDKHSFLSSLKHLRESLPNVHLVVGGDFNLITSLEKKRVVDGFQRMNVIFLEKLLKILT